MSSRREEELAEIARYLAERGVTACPPADADSIDLARLRDPMERRRAAMSRWPHRAGRRRGPQPALRARIAEELTKDPNRTNRAIAEIVGCCAMTVRRVRQVLPRQQTEGTKEQP